MILSRTKPSLFLPSIMVAWGAVSVSVKAIDTLGGMLAFRVVLGLLEAGFFPGVMLLLSCWYKVSSVVMLILPFKTNGSASALGAFEADRDLLYGNHIGGRFWRSPCWRHH